MSIAVSWDNDEHTVVRYRFEKRWTWDEFSAAKNEAVSMIDTVTHKVGIIMDAPSDVELPASMLTNARNALGKKHPNTAVIVIVPTNAFMRLMLNTLVIVSGTAGNTIQVANNLDEARALVAKQLTNV